MSADLVTAPDPSRTIRCPYCQGRLRWTAARWLAYGVFECERCGEFPDFRLTRREPTPARDYSQVE
jgi:DNA-directed RNA polymerase subunit RPC12/RpoP